jgi:hypothetical protein
VTRLPPRARQLLLTLHVAVSVGWLGAVVAFLGLAVAVLASDDAPLVRGAYLAMEVTGWWVLVPFSVGCLVTGVVQSLGSDWGLVRHYWVLSTLVINVVATAVLLMFMGTLGALADDVRRPGLSDRDVLGLRDPSPVVHAALAVLVLVLATWLSVAKPRGMTRYGQRRRRNAPGPGSVSSGLRRDS